tara:strand:- start:140 stop:286 length:147 start_codon:yes stop_codon:yes gene_type:complete
LASLLLAVYLGVFQMFAFLECQIIKKYQKVDLFAETAKRKSIGLIIYP